MEHLFNTYYLRKLEGSAMSRETQPIEFPFIMVGFVVLMMGFLFLCFRITGEINFMTPQEINVNVGITKNMGNYESLRLDYQMKVDLGPDDKPGPAIDSAREYLFNKMKDDLDASNGGKDLLRK